MKAPAYQKHKVACGYFFIIPSLAYGILTSRLPALKLGLHADDGSIGIAMLALGISTFLGLVASNQIIQRWGARRTTGLAVVQFGLSFVEATFATTVFQFTFFCALAGFGVGLCDVGMNSLGITLEKKSGILCLAFLHACSSIGGAAGSVSGSICADLSISPFWNLIAMLGLCGLAGPWAYKAVTFEENQTSPKKASLKGISGLPIFLIICGFFGLLCHIVEGSTAEWGSLLLVTIKKASQEQGALVYACFTGAMVICRLLTDKLRTYIPDRKIAQYGSWLAALGMGAVLMSPWPLVCLLGYTLMGIGIAPLTPLLFSRAGALPNISSSHASSVISTFSYSGLLFFPPFIGLLAESIGLLHSLWIIPAICIALAFGARILK